MLLVTLQQPTMTHKSLTVTDECHLENVDHYPQ